MYKSSKKYVTLQLLWYIFYAFLVQSIVFEHCENNMKLHAMT